MNADCWHIWADTGGTFTDAVAVSPDGQTFRIKVLSTGCLRAGVERVEGDRLYLSHSWGDWATTTDAARGWHLRALNCDEVTGIAGWSGGACAHLVRLPREVRPGSTVEVMSGEEAPILAARLLTKTPAGLPLPRIHMRLATTRGTNALLTGAIAPTALVINRGLGDLLRIGTQQRPDLFALDIRKPSPIHAAVIEVTGRLDARGQEIAPLDLRRLAEDAQTAVARGVRHAAICLLHADLNGTHEEAVAAVLRDAGFTGVSCSNRIAPFVKIVPRATTTLVNACLAPAIEDYLARVRSALSAAGSSLLVMTSAGGLVGAAEFLPRDSLLSGPAAGVVGAAKAAGSAGFDHAVSFDMGGTSTDAARWSRKHGLEYVFEHTVGAVTLVAPAAAVETVAAGGGSICSYRNGALCVGPESAGANPGPACYGAGGPLTLTDVNLLLGRLCPERFAIPVSLAAAEAAFEQVLVQASTGAAHPQPREQVLEGFLQIAAERMAGAVQRISTRRGHDLHGAALVAFGGAGGQHACAIAQRLDLSTVLVPRDAGLLSARGLGEAAIERFAEQQILAKLGDVVAVLDQRLAALQKHAEGMAAAGAGGNSAATRRRIAAVRFAGQESSLEIDLPASGAVDASTLRALFAARHAEIYGFAPASDRDVELVWLRVVAAAQLENAPGSSTTTTNADQDSPARTQKVCFSGSWVTTPVVERSGLSTATGRDGPLLITDDHCTIVVEPGWQAQLNSHGDVVLERRGRIQSQRAISESPAAIELFTARFESLACEMGEMLARTSVSVNVKERLDFSCALLDPQGSLIACAPHVPVHLGSLGVCVRAVTSVLPLGPGDSAITNHPAHGGSHLPDVTVISAVHDQHARLLGYVASRAHHAEMGGRTPGSMPPDATTLDEEGVILNPFKIVESGRVREDLLEVALRSGRYPSRNVPDNLADVRAALAANARGAAALRAMCADHGADVLTSFMEQIQHRSAQLMRTCIARLKSTETNIRFTMDDGSPICIGLTISGDELHIDFTHTADVHPGNLNATPAIVSSCVMYVMRVLLGSHGFSAPLNEGLLRPVRLTLPPGMLNPRFDGRPNENGAPPRFPAVVGGNVETSQRVVDALLCALELCACSQGTMNNFVFGAIGAGVHAPSYYETICGGAGAGPGFHGASAVHTHMTNTRITDPEVLERRYPVRLEQFAIRTNSGGRGQFHGGDGVERVIRFLAPQRVSLLTQRRVSGPPGHRGGLPGAAGEQLLARADGATTPLGSIVGFDAAPGDVLTIRTPGGGGWGTPS